MLILYLVKKQSFCHFENQASNQNTYLTKVEQFGMLLENAFKKLSNKLENFFYKRCSVGYAI